MASFSSAGSEAEKSLVHPRSLRKGSLALQASEGKGENPDRSPESGRGQTPRVLLTFILREP